MAQFREQIMVRTEISEQMLDRTERNHAKCLNAVDTVTVVNVVHSSLTCSLFKFHASGQ